ncbi:MAG: rhomboid family intramembrane serine protease [Litoreibacter sp.]|uniref:rhomboid family intramembrane serine protease n=1 Tax=Litoreibacter sp. TaxID=1969459 RepID=UPI003297B42A
MQIARLGPVTLSLILIATGVYAVLGPATKVSDFQSILQLGLGLFQHGNASHLAMNCFVLLLGGYVTEPILGPLRTINLVLLSAALGLTAELVLSGPGFVGLSGVAYGIAAFAMLSNAAHRMLNIALIVAVIIAEYLFLLKDVAVFSHLGGVLAGGGFAMFSSLFGSKGAQLKPMEWKHVSRAIEIIEQTDEDDAAEADRTFVNTGYENMFVLVEKGEVLGVTGFGQDDMVPDLAWLSWTYLDEAYMGQGYGGQMLNDMLGMLSKHGVRKIFIETSDYEEDGKKIYANAHRLYEEFGAKVELTIPDYHAVGEAKIIFGLDNPEAPKSEEEPATERDGLALAAVETAAETEDVAGLQWEEIPTGLANVDATLATAWERGNRMAVLAIPQDLSAANADGLTNHGLAKIGSLQDYYGPNQSQDWWVASPNN